ncbi:hypothetical protein ASD50_15075 [Mesorhizobium sp. Root552]|uniref:hypothetical protein n=1 Tax=Mesorhizobium sp. Root552 TaxID=1736555 RepID=UPI0006F66401|nr:hypothetical protein [Mesorhizobium sp. Root552]KQZ31589.1 hypothetical protein ASD50_15075 [Mesorhizobium sp. Root552]
MKLKALDQISISSVKSDSLRPNEEFVVSKSLGEELMSRHPTKFAVVDHAHAEEAKAEPAAPANKAVTSRKAKAEPANPGDTATTLEN